MAGPIWARWALALIYAGLAANCVAGLFVRRWAGSRWAGTRWAGPEPTADRQRVEGAHGLMAAGMAAMFAPVGTPIPAICWVVALGAQSAWLGLRLLRPAGVRADGAAPAHGRAHLVTHVLAGAVMAWVFAVMPAGPAAAGMSHLGHLGGSGSVFVIGVWVAAGVFLAQAVRCGFRMAVPHDHLAPESPSGHSAIGAVHSVPAVAGAELPMRVAMGLGMFYMLITML